MLVLNVVILVAVACGAAAQCNPTPTSASGTQAPNVICAGDLIFSDEFDYLDFGKWKHSVTMSGGGNNEFQYYTNNRTNSFVEEGTLHFRATLTADRFGGEDFLFSGTLDLQPEGCTDWGNNGCIRTGNYPNILPPAQSAHVTTVDSFRFRYGRIVFNAKFPAGDWLWPALWLMPQASVYGYWPASGEIDMAESRGNRNLMAGSTNVGVEQVGTTLHFGPYEGFDAFMKTHFEMNSRPGFDAGFHVYEMIWTENEMQFYVDGNTMGVITPPQGGFYELGDFAPGSENPWRNGGHMAPFDQEFYIIMNLAVGGTAGYFWDGFVNAPPKPWIDSSPTAFLDFWNARDAWLATWNQGDPTMQVDYVRVYAL